MEQCERRNTKLQHSETFDICDGDELYISSIDESNVNSHHWILSQRGKLTVSLTLYFLFNQTFPYRSLILVILNIGEYFVV